MIITNKICRISMARGSFIPTMCALCNKQRATCPNWQGWLEESPEAEVKEYDPSNPDHERN